MKRKEIIRRINGLVARRHNDALTIRKLKRRLCDGRGREYCFIEAIGGDSIHKVAKEFPELEKLPEYFPPSKLDAILNRIKRIFNKNGYGSTGRIEVHTINKYGHSRDFF